MGEHRSLSALQILALAEGPDKTAATKNAKIMRAVPGSDDRSEIQVNLEAILRNKMPDIPLNADDILFVPTSKTKAVGYRSLEALIQAGTFIAYRVP